jgi:hypothetical protein
MDRDDLMQRLIHDQLEKLDTGRYSHRMMRLVEDALEDLAGMSDDELSKELSRRGLSAEFDTPLDPIDEPDDVEADQDEDDYDVQVLLGGARDGDRAIA